MLNGRCNHLHFYTYEVGWGSISVNLLYAWSKVVAWQDVTASLNKGHLALGVHLTFMLGDSEMLIMT